MVSFEIRNCWVSKSVSVSSMKRVKSTVTESPFSMSIVNTLLLSSVAEVRFCWSVSTVFGGRTTNPPLSRKMVSFEIRNCWVSKSVSVSSINLVRSTITESPFSIVIVKILFESTFALVRDCSSVLVSSKNFERSTLTESPFSIRIVRILLLSSVADSRSCSSVFTVLAGSTT